MGTLRGNNSLLLRRVTQHVKDQNWLAVGIDFIIVVVGVFIGLQVSNWNDARADRALRSEYLTQLTADLRADMEEAGDTAASYWQRAAAIEDVFEAAGLQAPLAELYNEGAVFKAPPYPDFESDYPYAHNHKITFLPQFEISTETFDTLVANGHFELLRDAELVRQIQGYYRLLDRARNLEASIIRANSTLSEARYDNGIPLTGRTTLEDLATAVKADKRLAASLDSNFMLSASNAGTMVGVQQAAMALIEAIEEMR